MNATVTASSDRKRRRKAEAATGSPTRSIWSKIALLVGAFAFLFPFYYMIIGSLQEEPDSSPAGAFPKPGNLTLHNYSEINSAISLGRSRRAAPPPRPRRP